MTRASETPAEQSTRQATADCAEDCCACGDTPGSPALPDPGRRAVLSRRVRLLVTATITYNLVEAVVAISAGTVADSAALIGFGLDSMIEVASATAVAWQFSAADPEVRERAALRVIAVSFFALAAYVTVESIRSLAGATAAGHSTVGIVLAAASLVIMPLLSAAQRSAGRQLGSASAVADSRQTLLCTYLSGVLLVGLLLNSLFGLSWADPAVALVIAAVAVKEGRDAWRGRHCCQVVPDDPIDPDVDLRVVSQRRELSGSPGLVLGVIAIGGGLGALARYGLLQVLPTSPGQFPWGTLTANVLGCLLIGVLMVLVTEVRPAHRLVRPFLGVGVLGGFTTFSTYVVEINGLLQPGTLVLALLYLAGTLLGAMLAVLTGVAATRALAHRVGQRPA